MPSGEYYIVTDDIGDIDEVYWSYEEGLSFPGAEKYGKGFENSRLFESCEGVVNGRQLEWHFPNLGEIEDDEEVYAYRLEWHIVIDEDRDSLDEDNLAGWCMTLHDVSGR